MTISYFQGPIPTDSARHSTQQSERGHLRQAIKEFLTATSLSSPQDGVCPNCGRTMQHVDVMLSLYGADTEWKLQLPVCICSSSSDLSQRTGGGSTTDIPSTPEVDPKPPTCES